MGQFLLDGKTGQDLPVQERFQDCLTDRLRLFVSDLVIEECEAGDSVAAAERLELIQGIEILRGGQHKAKGTQLN